MKLIFKLLLGLPVGVTIIDTLGYVARVDGDSMKPTFNPLGNSDYVFLSKFSARNYQVVCNLSIFRFNFFYQSHHFRVEEKL